MWCDSQYCVEGANVWLESWKDRGWNKKNLNSPNRAAGEIKDLELWQGIDAALGDALIAGSAGNERADELAEMGRHQKTWTQIYVQRLLMTSTTLPSDHRGGMPLVPHGHVRLTSCGKEYQSSEKRGSSMTFTDWTAKAVEDRILEMADTLRKVPAVRGPKVYGSAMPEPVRRFGDAYGSGTARYRETASAGELGRMEKCFEWINALPSQSDREFLYAWSWVKVRTGLTIGAFAKKNDMSESTLRRAVKTICQRIADRLNQNRQIRLVAPDCAVTENERFIASTTVTSEKCATDWRASDARPQIDPALPKSRVLDPRKIWAGIQTRTAGSGRSRSLVGRTNGKSLVSQSESIEVGDYCPMFARTQAVTASCSFTPAQSLEGLISQTKSPSLPPISALSLSRIVRASPFKLPNHNDSKGRTQFHSLNCWVSAS
ncbi:hypothetical protein [Sinorhizobium sp. RAC02]|uniref:hypothetical protein n=1 Tax=Sinorhizobium sp. RAC02 TaxID=1842534 RepID=UPI00336BD21E